MPPNNAITDYLSKAIYEFNKTDDEYLIRVWDKYKTGTTVRGAFGSKSEDETEVYTMIQDLKGGDAPDLVVGIQKTYAMRDNIFMDLTGFLDQDVMDKQWRVLLRTVTF